MNNFSKWISAWLLIGCFLNMGGVRDGNHRSTIPG